MAIQKQAGHATARGWAKVARLLQAIEVREDLRRLF
jgi:hypothetical protein